MKGSAAMRTVACLVIVLWVSAPSGITQTASPAEHPLDNAPAKRDAVCGPRCVQYVIKHHTAYAPELIELVREVQWPRIEGGSSFADLQKALESRGIQTKALVVPGGRVPICENPCICHLRPEGASMGHFVVLLPGTTRCTALLWDNGSTSEIPAWEFVERFSGLCLLTGARTEAEPTGNMIMTMDSLAAWIAIYALLLLVSFCTISGMPRLFQMLRFRRNKGGQDAAVARQEGSLLHCSTTPE